jgi:myo-inositol-1(or 4)-monophosphatase
MDFEKICAGVCDLARETGKFIKEESKKFSVDKIEVKGSNNFVSYVDKTAEKRIINGLLKLTPDAGFIAEESSETDKSGKKLKWIIDPLDGTTNFIHGLSPYSISIALMDGNELVIGVVYEVGLSECFYAWKGGKAFLNGSEIKVSEVSQVKDSLIATGFPYYDYSKVVPFLDSLNHFFVNSHGVRRLGSAAVDLAYVACGRFESFYEYGLHPWDVAAGAFIIQQAGGKVTDFSGADNYVFNGEIIATNNNIYSEFYRDVTSFLKKE